MNAMRRMLHVYNPWYWGCRFNQARLRARQERSIAGVRDGLAEGGGAFGMGFYRGMTGIVTKPLEGAKSRGAYGVFSL